MSEPEPSSTPASAAEAPVASEQVSGEPALEPTEAPGAVDQDELPIEGLDNDLPVRPAIEAILLVVDEPISEVTLASVLGRPRQVITETLRSLAQSYTDEERGFELRELGGGWRLYTREQYADVVERFVLDGQQARLTQAALETLAVVAYRQPVSRTRVSAIRGVNCDGVMRTLLTRGLVEEAGVDEESGAHLYRTTSYFLERLGLQSIDELPDLAPYLPEMDQLDPEEQVIGHRRDAVDSDTSDAKPDGDSDIESNGAGSPEDDFDSEPDEEPHGEHQDAADHPTDAGLPDGAAAVTPA